MGTPLALGDVEAVDPELHANQIVYIRDRVYATRDGMTIADLELTFEVDAEIAEYTTKGRKRPAPIELKSGSARISVTEANRLEYLRLFVEQPLVGGITKTIQSRRLRGTRLRYWWI